MTPLEWWAKLGYIGLVGPAVDLPVNQGRPRLPSRWQCRACDVLWTDYDSTPCWVCSESDRVRRLFQVSPHVQPAEGRTA